jgi:rhodanese-related sulfurtransferase
VAKPEDVLSMLTSNETPNAIKELIPAGTSRLLLVCMVGGASLMAAKSLSAQGIPAQSLKGGIMAVVASSGKSPDALFNQGD